MALELTSNIRYQRFLSYYGDKNTKTDFCKAGISIADTSEGFDFQLWKVRLYKNGNVTIAPESSQFKDEVFITNFENATKISLAFDNDMRPMFGYISENSFNIYFYDSGSYTTKTIANARDGLIRINDVRPEGDSSRTVIAAYITETNLEYRLRDDEFTAAFVIQDDVHEWQRLYQCGMTENFIFQFSLVWDHKAIGSC